MADPEGRKLSEVEYESDEDDTTALQWTARRMEASDDDDDDDEVSEEDNVKETHCRRAIGLSSDSDESKGLDGAPEYYDELEEAGRGGDFDKVCQEHGDFREIVAVNHGRAKVESEEVFVPTSGWFYMHDDRVEWKSHGRSRAIRSGVKLLGCTDKQKWRHDKFEEMTLQDKSHQQQRKDRAKGHRCVRANQCESHDDFWGQQQGKNRSKGYINVKTNHYESHYNFGYHQEQRNNGNKGQNTNYFGNQNITSRTFKGRGTVRYKPPMKGKRLDTISKHQQPAKLQGRTSCSGFLRESSHTSAFSSDSPVPRIQQSSSNSNASLPLSDSMSSSIHGTFKTQRSNEKHGSIDKYSPTYIEKDGKHSALERKTASKKAGSKAPDCKASFQHIDGDHFNYQSMLFQTSADGGVQTSLSTQQVCQPCGPYPIYNNVNMLSLPLLRPAPEQRSITSRIQTHLPLFNHQTSHPGNGYQSFPKSLPPCSSVGILPHTSYFELDLIGRGSDFFTGVMQLGDRSYVGFAPSMAPTGYGLQSEQGSRTSEITSVRVGATERCNNNKPHKDRWAPEPVGNEFRQRQLQPRNRRYSEMSRDFHQNV